MNKPKGHHFSALAYADEIPERIPSKWPGGQSSICHIRVLTCGACGSAWLVKARNDPRGRGVYLKCASCGTTRLEERGLKRVHPVDVEDLGPDTQPQPKSDRRKKR